MTLQEIIETINKSNPKDWIQADDGAVIRSYCINNVNIQVIIK